jgi:hypothetical protein
MGSNLGPSTLFIHGRCCKGTGGGL